MGHSHIMKCALLTRSARKNLWYVTEWVNVCVSEGEWVNECVSKQEMNELIPSERSTATKERATIWRLRLIDTKPRRTYGGKVNIQTICVCITYICLLRFSFLDFNEDIEDGPPTSPPSKKIELPPPFKRVTTPSTPSPLLNTSHASPPERDRSSSSSSNEDVLIGSGYLRGKTGEEIES